MSSEGFELVAKQKCFVMVVSLIEREMEIQACVLLVDLQKRSADVDRLRTQSGDLVVVQFSVEKEERKGEKKVGAKWLVILIVLACASLACACED